MIISSYGLLVALGFLAAYGTSMYFALRNGVGDHVDHVLLWALIPAVMGARLLFVLYHLDYFAAQPGEIIAVWHGGWVWHGGLLGGLLGVYAYCKRAGIAFFSLLDILAPGVALGQAIGRWGNFLNQEAYGLPTNLPWGIDIDPERRLPGYESFSTFHPTFLYESLFDVALFFLLGQLLFTRLDPRLRGDDPPSSGFGGLRRGMQEARGDDRGHVGRAGLVFFLYLLLYSLGRFFVEFLRIDTVPVMAGLRAPQWISAGLIIIGAWGLTRVLHKQKKMIY